MVTKKVVSVAGEQKQETIEIRDYDAEFFILYISISSFLRNLY